MSDKKGRPISPVNGVPLPEGKRFEPGERAREIGRRGGKKCQANAKVRKTLREDLLAVLADMEIPQKDGGKKVPIQEALSVSLIQAALKGNVKAYETIRDTIGEKPVENINVSIPDSGVMDEVRKYLKGVEEQ